MTRIDRLEAFHLSDPDNPVLAGELVDALLAEGRIEQAQKVLASFPAPVRADPRLRFREARCALLGGRLPEAAEMLKALEQTQIEGPVLRHDLAFVQLTMGKVDAALKTLEPVLGDPDAPAAVHILHARLLHWQGDYVGGVRAIDHALSRAPDNAEALGVKALLLLDQGERDAAETTARAALMRESGQPEAAIVVGTLALWNQRLPEAESAFTSTLARQPASGRALLGLGQVELLHNDLPAARALLERAVAAMPNHIGSWHALAWCQLLSGDVAGAQASYERALGIDRTFGETHGGLAIVHALRGEADQARERIKRAQRLDPNGRSMIYARSLLLLEEGRTNEVRNLVAPVLASTPGAESTDPVVFLETLRKRMRGG